MRDERTTKDVCGEVICTRNPRSSKIIVTKEKERRKRKSEDKERRRRRKSNGCTLSLYNCWFLMSRHSK